MPLPPSVKRPPCNRRFVVPLLASLGLLQLACSRGGADAPGEAGRIAHESRVVVEGMTMAEVLALWGRPNVKVREGKGERWSYWARDAQERVIGKTYVLFDDRERVSDVVTPAYEEPARKREAPATITLSAGERSVRR